MPHRENRLTQFRVVSEGQKMHKRTLTLSLVFVAVGLSGCAHTDFRDTKGRNAATGIESGERIAIILGARNALVPSESDEKNFETCLTEAIRAEEPKLAIMRTEEFRRSVFPGIGFQDLPRDIEALLPLLTDAEHRERMASLKLRYLVILEVSTETTKSWWTGGIAPQVYSSYVGKSRNRHSHLIAQILDLREGRHSGELNVWASGKSGGGAWFLAIFPIPYYFSAPTESRACDSLGRATARFVMEKGS
jgi:hypothetical protein